MKKQRYKNRRTVNLGSLKKKILLLLFAGIALSASKSMSKQFGIIGEVRKEWKEIDRDSLKRSLIGLYSAKLIDLRPRGESFEIVLSNEGKREAMRLDLENMELKKVKWDGNWRVILSDIPERLKKVRDATRFHFKKLGLIEYQKSVFITPYPCEQEIKFIAEFYRAHQFIRFMIVKAIDDEKKFRHKFKVR